MPSLKSYCGTWVELYKVLLGFVFFTGTFFDYDNAQGHLTPCHCGLVPCSLGFSKLVKTNNGVLQTQLARESALERRLDWEMHFMSKVETKFPQRDDCSNSAIVV